MWLSIPKIDNLNLWVMEEMHCGRGSQTDVICFVHFISGCWRTDTITTPSLTSHRSREQPAMLVSVEDGPTLMKSMATDQNNVIVTGKSLNNYGNRNHTFQTHLLICYASIYGRFSLMTINNFTPIKIPCLLPTALLHQFETSALWNAVLNIVCSDEYCTLWEM